MKSRMPALDGLHRRYAEATSMDSLAFDGGLRYIVALLRISP